MEQTAGGQDIPSHVHYLPPPQHRHQSPTPQLTQARLQHPSAGYSQKVHNISLPNTREPINVRRGAERRPATAGSDGSIEEVPRVIVGTALRNAASINSVQAISASAGNGTGVKGVVLTSPGGGNFYRGQAGGGRSGRGLGLKLWSRKKKKGKGIPDIITTPITRTIDPIVESDATSMLGLGPEVPALDWERETTRILNARSQMDHSPRAFPASDSASQISSVSTLDQRVMGQSGSEDDRRAGGHRQGTGSDETAHGYPPPQYSSIHPSASDKKYSRDGPNRQHRALPKRPNSPTTSPASISYSPPSTGSLMTTSIWPTPPASNYSPSISPSSLSSSPPVRSPDLRGRQDRSNRPGTGSSTSMNTPASPLGAGAGAPIGLPGIPGGGAIGLPPGGTGTVSGVVSGVDAEGRPYQYSYQYQYQPPDAPPASPLATEHVATTRARTGSIPYEPGDSYVQQSTPQSARYRPNSPTGSHSPRQAQRYPHSQHSYSASPSSPVPPRPPPPTPLQKNFSANLSPRAAHPPRRLLISGIGAAGADELEFDFDLALEELHLDDARQDRHNHRRQKSAEMDDGDSDVDPGLQNESQLQKQGQRVGGSGGGASSRSERRREGAGDKGKEREQAVIRWCRGFGDIREVRRRGVGCLMMEFTDESIVDSICHLKQVYIKGAGTVNLGWC